VEASYLGLPAALSAGASGIPLGVIGIGFDRAINFDGSKSEELHLTISSETSEGTVVGLSGIIFGSINGATPDIVIVSGFEGNPGAYEPEVSFPDEPDRVILKAPIEFNTENNTLTIRYVDAQEDPIRPVRRIHFENPEAAPPGSTLVFTQGTLSAGGEGGGHGDGYGLNGLLYNIVEGSGETFLGWPWKDPHR
jgi:hypothetical protein